MRTFPKEAFELQSRPLCRHYVIVLMDALAVEVEGDAGVENVRALQWAFGVLDDGQCDVFDAWSAPLTKTPDWRESFATPKDRGADRIDLVASRRSLIPQEDLSAIYPSARSLAAADALPSELLAALSHRRMVRGWRRRLPGVDACNRGIDGASDVHDRVQALANRPVSRHGRFADEVSATALALKALERAEQRVVAMSASLKIPGWCCSSARRCGSDLTVEAGAGPL